MGHFTRFWGGLNYPQDSYTRPDKRAACRPAFGRGLIAKLTQLLAHGRLFAAQPRRQERTDSGQRTGAGQHHPRLHRAKTVACGLVKWGKWVWMIVVHSVIRGWQDIGVLLGVMG